MTRKSKARRERDLRPEDEKTSAFISLDEDTYVRAVWFVECERCDVLGWMYRPKGEHWRIGYRFRHYVDGKAFDSEDRKNAWSIKPNHDDHEPTEAELAQIESAMDETLALVAARERRTYPKAYMQKLDCRCLGPEAGERVKLQPWANVYYAGQTVPNVVRGMA
jgi:hypothetical protein